MELVVLNTNEHSDQLLDELLVLEAEIKDMSKRVDEIKKWCKERGSFSTSKYVCAIKTRSMVKLVSLEVATKILGTDMIQECGLTQTITFPVVSVSRLGK